MYQKIKVSHLFHSLKNKNRQNICPSKINDCFYTELHTQYKHNTHFTLDK